MKSIFRSRRHRNPLSQQESRQENHTPFFSKIGGAMSVQAKPEPFFQAKLTIGQPGDPYEREADAIADQVVNQQAHTSVNTTGESIQRQPISAIQRLATPEEDKMPATNDARMAEDKRIQEKPEIQKMDKPEEEEPVQAKAEEEEPIQAKAGEEEEPIQAKEEEEEPMQAKADIQRMEAPEQKEEEKATPSVQTKSNNAGKASPALTSKIKDSRGKGKPIPAPVRNQMEQHFGRDFSQVNIHTDSQAGDMNKQLNAQAFTHGSDIYFNSGKFNPQSTEGVHLLAHELTHTVQQNSGKVPAIQQKAAGSSAANIGKKNTAHSFVQRKTPDTGGASGSPAPTPTPAGGIPAPLPKFDFPVSVGFFKNFDATYAPDLPKPQEGTLTITHRIGLVFDKKIDDTKRDKFRKDFQKHVPELWQDKFLFELKDSDFTPYSAHVKLDIQFVDDPKDAHTLMEVKNFPKEHRSNVESRTHKDFPSLSHVAHLDLGDPSPEENAKKQAGKTIVEPSLIKHVGNFDFDSAEINTPVEKAIKQVGDHIDTIPATATADDIEFTSSIEYIGRASPEGNKSYNKKLSEKRAKNVKQRLEADKPRAKDFTSILTAQGADKTANEANKENYRRVNVLVTPATVFTKEIKRSQNTAAHEFGHMLGFGDEYSEAGDKKYEKKIAGDRPSHYEDVKSIMGQEIADELTMSSSSGMMSMGNDIKKGHYAYFLKAIRDLTGKSGWNIK